MKKHWKIAVEKILSGKYGTELKIDKILPIGGGCINEAFKLETQQGSFFVKMNNAQRYPKMFEKEAKGLHTIEQTQTLMVPKVIGTGITDQEAFLLLQYIKPKDMTPNFWQFFGKQLAQLHQNTQTSYGLEEDNYIGSLIQFNSPRDSWIDFFIEQRLEQQLKLARDNGRVDRSLTQSFNRFYKQLDQLFPTEPPALLHGDLWSGNYMINNQGKPLLIDPAIYYGHREMDLAMSQLFGGFNTAFYEAYHDHFPLENGWQKRLNYCNLYPLLVHVNLFGSSYLSSIKSVLKPF